MQCSHETLHERAVPLDDSGTLPAFCSIECAKEFGLKRVREIYDEDSIFVLDCGCVVGMSSPECMTPFPVCAGDGDPFGHFAQICDEATRLWRAKNE
jgi:hypothetical protein